MASGGVKGRKRVEVSSEDAASTTSLLRARNGSAFARWYYFTSLLYAPLFLGSVIVMLIITILLSIPIFNLLIKSFLLIERRFVCVYFTVNFNFNFNYGACKSD